MNRIFAGIILCFTFLYASLSYPDSAQDTWYTIDSKQQVILNIDLFLSTTCPFCYKTDEFFKKIETTQQDLQVRRFFINQDKNALMYFNRLILSSKMEENYMIPSIYFCNTRWIGFATAEITGKDLLKAMDFCRQQIQKEGYLSKSTLDTLNQWANANQFNTNLLGHPANLFYLFTVAFFDAGSPCSIFFIMLALSVLYLTTNRSQMWIGAFSLVFIVCVLHFTQQTQPHFYYQLLTALRVPAIVAGLMGLLYVYNEYTKRWDGIAHFLLIIPLILTAYMFQQTCTMNWSAVFQQWLNNHNFTLFQTSLYQLIYQFTYLFLTFTVIFLSVYFLKRPKRLLRQPQYKLASTAIISLIALILIAQPFLLALHTFSVIMVAGIFISIYFYNRA